MGDDCLLDGEDEYGRYQKGQDEVKVPPDDGRYEKGGQGSRNGVTGWPCQGAANQSNEPAPNQSYANCA